jgi:benzodiazapine receptor
MTRRTEGLLLAGFLALTLGGGFIAGQMVTPGLAWYGNLAKPAFTPPAWVFAPVWTTLYVAMAVAAWRIAVRAGRGRPLALWLLQLALNLIWPAIFFGLHAPVLALAELGLLACLLFMTVGAFWPKDRLAAVLMLPVLVWVLFAGLLNAAIWRLNG